MTKTVEQYLHMIESDLMGIGMVTMVGLFFIYIAIGRLTDAVKNLDATMSRRKL